MRLALALASTILLLANSNPSRGDDALASKVLNELKGTTVFIFVKGDDFSSSGSGFVAKLDDSATYLVTNHHVAKPEIVIEKEIWNPFTRRRETISTKVPMTNPRLTVILHSGTREELSLPAEVLASDEDNDLAVLKLSKKIKGVRPLDFTKMPELRETMPVYVLGFPYGTALAADKGNNPNISVGKASISSIRRKKNGDLAVVEINGALNPGNSGGPIVDNQGQLVGISVATIKGSGIGFAIPPAHLVNLVQGKPGKPRFTSAGGAKPSIQIEVPLLDPFHGLKSVSCSYVPTNTFKDGTAIHTLSKAKSVKLKIEKNKAIGTMSLDGAGQELTCQLNYINASGKTLVTESLPLKTENAVASLPMNPAAPTNPPSANIPSPRPSRPSPRTPQPFPRNPGQRLSEKVNQANFDKVSVGMTEAAVTGLLGEPTRTRPFGDEVIWTWQDAFKIVSIHMLDGKVSRKSGLGLDRGSK